MNLNPEDGGILFEWDKPEEYKGYVRAYSPTQHTILTIASSDFPNNDFEQGESVYVRVNKHGKCEVTDQLEKETFLMRVVERTLLQGLDAYTFIVSKTKYNPIINKGIEDQYIGSYLRKDLVTEIKQ